MKYHYSSLNIIFFQTFLQRKVKIISILQVFHHRIILFVYLVRSSYVRVVKTPEKALDWLEKWVNQSFWYFNSFFCFHEVAILLWFSWVANFRMLSSLNESFQSSLKLVGFFRNLIDFLVDHEWKNNLKLQAKSSKS